MAALFGLIAGVVGSLIAPWVNWGIEKRREKLLFRRQQLTNWRQLIHDVSEYQVQSIEETRHSIFRELVQGHKHFYSLEAHLSERTLSLIENTGGKFWSHDGVDRAFRGLQADVNRIERDWKLI